MGYVAANDGRCCGRTPLEVGTRPGSAFPMIGSRRTLAERRAPYLVPLDGQFHQRTLSHLESLKETLHREQTDDEDGGRKIMVVGFGPSAMPNCGEFFEIQMLFATIAAGLHQGSDSSSRPASYNVFSYYVDSEPMDPAVRRQKRRDVVLSSLNVAIEASNLAQELCTIMPAKPIFAAFSIILTMIKVNLFCARRSIGG
jgi:hypothetical protein